MVWNRYPYTDFHEINLDWIIGILKEMEKKLDDFVVTNSIKYADPFQWSIVNQYEKNTLVIEPNTGTAYLSVQAVPQGVNISNTDYWTPVFDLSQLFSSFNDNLTFNNEQVNIISMHAYSVDDWLIWKNRLYLVTAPISIGDALSPGTNIELKSVEELIDAIYTSITNAITTLDNRVTTIENGLFDNAIDITKLGASTGLDNTSIINGAFTDHDVVVIPAGVWPVSQIVIPANKTLVGFDATLKALDNNNKPLLVGDGCDNAVVKGLSFDMNTGNNTVPTRVLYIKNADDVLVTDCKFESAVLDGNLANGTMFVCMESCTNSTFEKCVASNSNDEGLGFLSSSHCTIDNCVGKNNPFGSIFLLNRCTYSTVKNCDASDSWGSCIGINSTNCVCENNYVHDCDAANFGIIIGHNNPGLTANFSKCVNNTLFHCADGIGVQGSIYTEVIGNTIIADGVTHNTRTNQPTYGITVGDGSSRAVISNNHVSAPYGGIAVYSNCVLSDNVIWAVTGAAIVLYEGLNRINNCRVNIAAIGIFIPNDATLNNVISDCTFSSVTTTIQADYPTSQAKTYANDCLSNNAISGAVANNCNLL